MDGASMIIKMPDADAHAGKVQLSLSAERDACATACAAGGRTGRADYLSAGALVICVASVSR